MKPTKKTVEVEVYPRELRALVKLLAEDLKERLSKLSAATSDEEINQCRSLLGRIETLLIAAAKTRLPEAEEA